MVDPNIITPATNNSLREAAAKYFGHIIEPRYLDDVDGFMRAYTGVPFNGTKAMVTGTETQVVVHMVQDLGWDESVTIDLREDHTARLMELTEPKNPDSPDLVPGRYLTEQEGEELCMDLHSIVARMPADNVRTFRTNAPPATNQ